MAIDIGKHRPAPSPQPPKTGEPDRSVKQESRRRVPVWARVVAGGGALIAGATGVVVATSGGGSESQDKGKPAASSPNVVDTPSPPKTEGRAQIEQWANEANVVNYNSEAIEQAGVRQFIEEVRGNWLTRFEKIRNGDIVGLTPHEKEVQVIGDMKMILQNDSGISVVENGVAYGFKAGGAYDAEANDPNDNYQNFVYIYPETDGTWDLITLQQDGVGWATDEGTRLVGLLTAETGPRIYAGEVDAASISANGFTLLSIESSPLAIAPGSAYPDIESALATELEANPNLQPTPLTSLPLSVQK